MVDKTASCRFDTNRYSVPPDRVKKTLTLAADDREMRFLDGAALVARHARCWGRRQPIEASEHRAALVDQRQGAGEAKGRDRLRAAVPTIDALYERWVDAGRNLGSMTARTLKLLELYGTELLDAAVEEVLARGMHDPGALAALCEQRRCARALYEELLELGFLSRGENVLFRGQSGVGKTNLAQALAHAALLAGRTVRFTTLAAALADLSRQESVPALERRLRRYTRVDLLVLDELGYLPCDGRSADLLYNVISRRHEQRATVITTNLAYKQWSTVFPGAACVGALVDRFARHCQVVDIDADSWRHKEASERSVRKKRS